MNVVIMTGGKGTRLAPYTQVLPKGLLPIGGQPILEIIIKQLAHYGFKSITMACGYLAPLIQTYFGDGSKWNVSIAYYVEDQPSGTFGALKHMKHMFQQPFLLINCDILTTLNFRQFYDFHCSKSSMITIASQIKRIPIDLGVIETDGDKVTKFIEKPNNTVHVNMGIYMINPKVYDYLPEENVLDTTDVIKNLLDRNHDIRHYQNDAFWLDIGKPADYKQANNVFKEMAEILLPKG
ncbi:NTP transferase domain-containing protein [Fodinisporobacter ferrooxydans]|uniref:NTP transferase domain-containing protein n=1 Tax=Fodinisporobacter ferrooxydans TaxID=2901836 RepID=A0ABY4CI60_9BACL|nr:NTP transferase domain-containing protein [Alicyclobacillaceae bacterium MYW30-H2]